MTLSSREAEQVSLSEAKKGVTFVKSKDIGAMPVKVWMNNVGKIFMMGKVTNISQRKMLTSGRNVPTSMLKVVW